MGYILTGCGSLTPLLLYRCNGDIQSAGIYILARHGLTLTKWRVRKTVYIFQTLGALYGFRWGSLEGLVSSYVTVCSHL